MRIEKGTLYINRTVKYLFPTLQNYGSLFRAKFTTVFSLAIGIHDCLLDGTPFESERKICILLDKTFQPARFQDFLNWIKYQEYYMTDYSVGDFTGWQHMIIIKYPETLGDVYDKFVEGKYSKMYTKGEIRKFFPDPNAHKDPSPLDIQRVHAKQVIVKSPIARDQFVKEVYTRYGTPIDMADIAVNKPEYDFPPDQKEEFFNFK